MIQKDFSGCNVLIYRENGDLLTNEKIVEHNKNDRTIVVQDSPALNNVKRCGLLILTEPSPYAYKGTIHKHDMLHKLIGLYQEKEAENRKSDRYKVDLPAKIDSLIINGRTYPKQTPLEVRVVNISKSGIRLRAKPNAVNKGNIFDIRVENGGKDYLRLTAEVINCSEVSPEYSEFGCRLTAKATV